MALDPNAIAALVSGASSGAKTTTAAGSSTGIDWGAAKKNQPGAWSLGQSIIDILSTGGYASAGITRKVGENVAAIQRGDLGGLLDLLNPLSIPGAAAKGVAERRTYSDNLRDLGVEGNTATWLGLALDIGLDPTTYITGGTIAGVKGTAAGARLASAANKANAKVVKSAAEAAEQNIPDVSRPYIPSEVPLTQGQKMGNYLTGVLRGYEYNKTAYLADRANTKAISKLKKEVDKARKTGNTDLVTRNEETLIGLLSSSKTSNASIADDLLLQRRQEFFRTVSQSPVLQQKLGKRGEKLAKLTAKEENLKFIDPKTAKKVDAETASASAKAGQIEEASKIETTPIAPIEEIVSTTNPIRQAIEKNGVVEDGVRAKELAKLDKSYKRDLVNVQTKYGAVAKEALDFMSRTVDPATKRRLSATVADDENPLAVLAELLRTGKVNLSANTTQRFADALGVSADPQQSVVELMAKTLVSVSKATNALMAKEDKINEIGNALARGIGTGFENATTGNAASGAGMVNGPAVGAKVDEVIDLRGEIDNHIDDIIEQQTTGTKGTKAKTQEELTDQASALKSVISEELIEDLGVIEAAAKTGSSLKFNFEDIFLDYLENGPKKNIEDIAAAENRTIKSVIDERIDRARTGREVGDFDLKKGDIRIDLVNSEARIPIHDKIIKAVRAKEGRKDPVAQLNDESRLGRGIENFLRFINISVRTRENQLMQLRRDGKANVGDKVSDDFVAMDMDMTYYDIAAMAVKKGGVGAEVFAALRYPGKAFQNVMPTNFEYAFLTLARYKQLGKDLSKGSEAWNEIRKAFDEAYTFKTVGDGVVPKKAPVADYFKPADHLDPKRVVGGKKLKKIADLDAKTNAAIQFMIDNSDELLDISSTRAAARMADEVAKIVPDTAEAIANMVRFSVFKSDFIKNAERLRTAPPVAADAEDAIITGIRGVAGFAQVEARFITLIKSVAQGSKVFDDPALAGQVLDTTMNMFMNRIINTRGQFQGVDPEDRKAIIDTVQSAITRLKAQVSNDISMEKIIGNLTPGAELTPAMVKKGKGARHTQLNVKMEESESLIPLGMKNKDDAAEAFARAGVKATDERSSFPNPHAEGNIDEALAGRINAITNSLKAVVGGTFSEKWLLKFSGRFKLGLSLKSTVGGTEYINMTLPGLFQNSLRAMFVQYGKDIPRINNAFRLLQKWGKEMAARENGGASPIPFSEWAKTADIGNADLEIADAFSDGIASMFGADGVLSNSIQHTIFADELNAMFALSKFYDVGNMPLRLPDKAGPVGIKYSWADAKIVDEKGKEEFTSLTFLSNYAHALHAVQTRIGIGAHYSRHNGKTLQQIQEEGLEIEDFIRLDPEDEFAKYVDPDKFFNAAEWEKLRYLKEYVLYPKSFSSETMQKIVDFSDMITSALKAAHTTWRAGHHVTAAVGEAIMNAFDGVTSPKFYSNSFSVLREFDPSVYKGDPNVFKAYAEIGAPEGMKLKATGVRPDGTEISAFDEIGYINVDTGKYNVVPNIMVARMGEQLGVITRGAVSTVEDVNAGGLGGLAGGVVGPVSRFNSKLAEISSHRDNYFRMAHFIKEIERGGAFKSFEEAAMNAAKKVLTYHPTIGGLSAFERKYMRRGVYFYTWQRIAATKVFELLLEQPGKVIIPSKIQYAFAESNGFNPESFGDPWDPDGVYASWHTGSLYGPQFQGPGGKGDAWGFGPAVPQLDIMNSLLGQYDIQPGQSGLDVLVEGSQNLAGQNLSPLPKWFVEITSGNRVGTGGDINNYLEYAIDQVGGLNTLSKITGIGQDPERSLTPTEQAERKTRLLVNWFLGQKLQDYSTSQTIKQWNTDQRLMIQRLTGQE
jgi:hypothetical protein